MTGSNRRVQYGSGFKICRDDNIGYIGDCGVSDDRQGRVSEMDEQLSEVSKEVDSCRNLNDRRRLCSSKFQ